MFPGSVTYLRRRVLRGDHRNADGIAEAASVVSHQTGLEGDFGRRSRCHARWRFNRDDQDRSVPRSDLEFARQGVGVHFPGGRNRLRRRRGNPRNRARPRCRCCAAPLSPRHAGRVGQRPGPRNRRPRRHRFRSRRWRSGRRKMRPLASRSGFPPKDAESGRRRIAPIVHLVEKDAVDPPTFRVRAEPVVARRRRSSRPGPPAPRPRSGRRSR